MDSNSMYAFNFSKKEHLEAYQRCKEAWAAYPEARYGWNIHHEIEIEALEEPIQARIDYILLYKSSEEIVYRLNNLRPVIDYDSLPEEFRQSMNAYEAVKARSKEFDLKAFTSYNEYNSLYLLYNKVRRDFEENSRLYAEKISLLHKKEVPDTTWNGRTIFNDELSNLPELS